MRKMSNPERYIVAACRTAPSINDPDFPVHVVVVEATSRIDALRQARDDFNDLAMRAARAKDWTHLKIVDGPPALAEDREP